MKTFQICFLVNNFDEFNFSDALERYLPSSLFDIKIVSTFPDDPLSFDLIIPWSFRRKIDQIEDLNNIVIIHSSDLPAGRGWAPIYNSIKSGQKEFVITAIVASREVDAGDIVMRARFPIFDDYTASFIRNLDIELSLVMIDKILKNWPDGQIVGISQVGEVTYNPRRRPFENQINITNTIQELMPHLRGVESSAPAFFFYNGIKYLIEIMPEIAPNKPAKVIFEYPALKKIEVWSDWK